MVKLGTYQHYKNKKFYKVISIAKHSETLEDMVVYEAQYDNPVGKVWVRPLKMFEETVEYEDKKVPRFSFVKD